MRDVIGTVALHHGHMAPEALMNIHRRGARYVLVPGKQKCCAENEVAIAKEVNPYDR
eukprot:CAMPEP_0180509056 /NCGR_PEP_ID=MMETSP1036_2-20121128/49509_1 /TAXON_ID=632150 /ORGANISM="Azadinium spinosum, Strain 3D9" /LENGTH=56 /DNA_ID=CAMNT_0022519419 /DNA_START=187 /DNA_END=354 /DNA_ORIENTATION=-